MEIDKSDFHDSFSPGEAIGCSLSGGFFNSLKRAAQGGTLVVEVSP